MTGFSNLTDRLLVVEDDRQIRGWMVEAAGTWAVEVIEAANLRDGLALLGRKPTAIVCDVRLPDGTGLDLIERAVHLVPMPAIVAISGKAGAHEAFALAQLGVRRFLKKPFGPTDLRDAVDGALHAVPNIDPQIVACVGGIPMLELQRRVRQLMAREALARKEGNRSAAARVLGITRQAVQQLLRRGE